MKDATTEYSENEDDQDYDEDCYIEKYKYAAQC